MAKKKRGYVELEWTCPNCGNENPGSVRICGTCGTPQPDNVEFHQPRHQELITDQEKLKQAKAGADIQCAYCDARNPATFKSCSQCGSDLGDGAQREIGRVVGAFKPGPAGSIECENCATQNSTTRTICHNCGSSLPVAHQDPADAPAKPTKTASKPKQGITAGAIVGILVVCFGIAALAWFLFFRTTDVVGQVIAVEWERTIAIEVLGPEERDDWLDQLPADAENVSCSEKLFETTSNQPISGNYTEVCGTPYTIDTGGGFGEVVQDCEYEVFDDYCSYTVLDWIASDSASLSGSDFTPVWPNPSLSLDQRRGEETESYTCIFDADGKTYRYETDDLSAYLTCQIGETFTLEVNTIGGIVSITP